MFIKAFPVWHDEGRNTHLVLTATAPKGAILRVAASTFYKLYINGAVVGFGPARTGRGYARVDEYAVEGAVRIEAAGYHCYSLSTAYQDSFCCAEIAVDGVVIAATGGDGFATLRNGARRQKVERYSMQRHFTEIYDEGKSDVPVEVFAVPAPQFISRRAPYADMTYCSVASFSRGRFTDQEPRRKNAYTTSMLVEQNWGKFSEEEIPDKPFRRVDAMQFSVDGQGQLPVTLRAGEWVMFDRGAVEVGFPYIRALAQSDAQVLLAVSEYCEDTFAFVPKMNCQCVIQYDIPSGHICDREAFEMSSFRKIAVMVTKGEVTVEAVGFRRFVRDCRAARQKTFADPILQGVYDAALRTFSHNAVDLFTDCPSRERAGWLCDSFFTARAEHYFFGTSEVESAFLENYLLYRYDDGLPKGVLPMAYPSDPHENHKFIPQWDMWYVLQVCEYLTKRDAAFTAEDFRPTVTGVLDFLTQYENEYGLLEDLPSWNFVEWSDANSWTKNVNFPTNFLYAALLDAAADVFGMTLHEKAAHIRNTVKKMAFNGEVFVDHALRINGKLVNCEDVSEACQYYAALFGQIGDEEYDRLWCHIKNGFSAYDRPMCRINAFIGMYLRMWTLSRLNDRELLYENIKRFFGGMSEKTGTLWEYKTQTNSLNHGFAAFVAALM